MKIRVISSLSGVVLMALAGAASAKDYCTIPYLYATNIRSACEQLGANGLATLYQSNRFIDGVRHAKSHTAARVR